MSAIRRRRSTPGRTTWSLTCWPRPGWDQDPDHAALSRQHAAGRAAARHGPIYKANFAAAPSIKLEQVDHSLHFIMLDQPAAFAADLDAFLAG